MKNNGFPKILLDRIREKENQLSKRILSLRGGVDFSSNDYLGFSEDKELRNEVIEHCRGLPLGATGSRLLRGNFELFEATEALLASFCGREATLLFSSGYQANIGLLTGLLRNGDLVFSDQFNHASIIDGIRLSGATKKIFPHQDVAALRILLESEKTSALKLIVTESLFSMDGDQAPLKELADLAEEFSALLVVDEAHATGIWGDFSQNQGGGLVQALGLSDRVFATIHPCGKALGLGGAWISGDHLLKEYLVNESRPTVFSTAPLPFLAASLQAVIPYWRKVGQFRSRQVLSYSRELVAGLSHQTEGLAWVPSVIGPIVPVVLGDNQTTLRIAASMQQSGFDVRAIRPPTVPQGQSRLRLTVNAGHSLEQIRELVQRLSQAICAQKKNSDCR